MEQNTDPPGNAPGYVELLLAETRSEVERADAKAGIVLATLGVGFGALSAGVFAGTWNPGELGNTEWVFWLSTILAGGSVGVSGAAVWPRFKTHRSGTLHYWGDVVAVDSLTQLERQLLDSPQPIRRSVEQLWVLSRIVVTKYRLVRVALALAGSAVALGAMSFLMAGG